MEAVYDEIKSIPALKNFVQALITYVGNWRIRINLFKVFTMYKTLDDHIEMQYIVKNMAKVNFHFIS